MISRTPLALLLPLLLDVEPAFGFVAVHLHHQQRHPPTTTGSASTTTLSYKVLGAPAEGSYKPSVLEEGTNKIVTGNLSGSNSSPFFRRRAEAQTSSNSNDNNSAMGNGQQTQQQQQQQQGYSAYDNTKQSTDVHTEELRHWNGVLELETQRQAPDGSLCVGGSPWEAGTVLADFMTNPDCGVTWQDQFVVELGCGIGTCAIVAAMLGARVVATDADPTALQLTQENSAKYKEYCAYPVEVAQLVWGDNDAAYQVCQGQYPGIILLADVVYSESDVESLHATVQAMCGPDTLICWAHTWREQPDQEQYVLDSFLNSFERFDIDVALLPPSFQTYRPDGRTPVSIFVYRRLQQ